MQVQIDEGDLTAWLASRGAADRVLEARRIGGGASRHTWLVTAERDGARRLFVVRMDGDGGGVVPTSLRREYDLMTQLHAADVLVAEPLAYEEDPEILGDRFYVREGFDGVSGSGSAAAEARRHLALELAGELARLHQVPVDAVDMPDRPERTDAAAAIVWEVDHWYEHWCRADLVSPGITFLHRWLRSNVPSTPGDAVVLWGDVGLANVVASDHGELVALSDWELATYGDPNRDVASGFWRGLDRVLDLTEFEQAYRAAGGRALDRTAIRYYEVFMNWQVALFTHCAGATVGHGRSGSLHPALLSTWLHRLNLRKALGIVRAGVVA